MAAGGDSFRECKSLAEAANRLVSDQLRSRATIWSADFTTTRFNFTQPSERRIFVEFACPRRHANPSNLEELQLRLPDHDSIALFADTFTSIGPPDGDVVVRATPARSLISLGTGGDIARLEGQFGSYGGRDMKVDELYSSSIGDLKITCVDTANSGGAASDAPFHLELAKPQPPLAAIQHLNAFSSIARLARGHHCGSGNIVGYSPSGYVSHVCLGFHKVDDPSGPCPNWATFLASNEIDQAFRGLLYLDEKDRQAFDLATEFYRAATVVRCAGSLEIAIVAAQATLEYLVQFVLIGKAGWSKTKLANQKFSTKLRAAAEFIGFSEGPLEGCTELETWGKRFTDADGYQLLTKVRNGIVHPPRPNGLGASELVQSWEALMFIAELFMFFVVDVRGQMADRRQTRRFWGNSIDIPLP